MLPMPTGVYTVCGEQGWGMQANQLVSLPHPSMVVGNELESSLEST